LFFALTKSKDFIIYFGVIEFGGMSSTCSAMYFRARPSVFSEAMI